MIIISHVYHILQQVLDHETWSFNLTEANMAGQDVLPNWQKLYSFRETFGLDSLLPQELDQFVKRLATDTQLQDLYYR
jgi:Acid sphingomyelin phosphodiesterase C-terminal region